MQMYVCLYVCLESLVQNKYSEEIHKEASSLDDLRDPIISLAMKVMEAGPGPKHSAHICTYST